MVYVIFTDLQGVTASLTLIVRCLQSCITMSVCDSACVAVLGVILT